MPLVESERIAGPILANWKASRKGQARLTSARFDAEVRHIETESKTRSLQLIAEAQSIDTTIESVHGMVEITRDEISQSIEFQGRKRLANTSSVVEGAADELGGKEVSDHEPNHDWTARVFNYIQDVSSEEMRLLWAKVLAGEVQRPGSTSIQALSILRNLDQATARLFKNLCSACVSIRVAGDHYMDTRVPSLGGNAAHNALKDYGLAFANLNVLNEHGLIISDYNSWYDYRMCTGIRLPAMPDVVRVAFSFQGRNWNLLPITERVADQEFKLSGVALTRSGLELSRIVDLEPMNEYAQALMDFLSKE